MFIYKQVLHSCLLYGFQGNCARQAHMRPKLLVSSNLNNGSPINFRISGPTKTLPSILRQISSFSTCLLDTENHDLFDPSLQQTVEVEKTYYDPQEVHVERRAVRESLCCPTASKFLGGQFFTM